jgi:Tfp pilus assembly protein PilV
MKKIQKNESGFSAVEVLLVILILVVIGAVGYMVYHNNHKTTASVTTTASTKPATAPKTTTTTPDPYAGWKTYELSVEKLNFKYPADWTVSDTSSATQDNVVFTATDGSQFNISDDNSNGGDTNPEASNNPVPVTYVGQSDYLVFGYGRGDRGQGTSDGLISGALLQTGTDISNGYPFPTDKYATAQNTVDFGPDVPTNYMIISYNTKAQVSLADAQTTQMFKDAKLVIESMHY